MQKDLASARFVSAFPKLMHVPSSCILVTSTKLQCYQEAGKDLKNKLNERQQQDDEKPLKFSRSREARATASDATRCITNGAMEVPPPEAEWSSPAQDSEEENSDCEDKEEASSDDEDKDIFGGKFAIRDKDVDAASARRDDRFGALPRNAAKYLDNFEEDVLKSIPKDLSERLVFTYMIGHYIQHLSQGAAFMLSG